MTFDENHAGRRVNQPSRQAVRARDGRDVVEHGTVGSVTLARERPPGRFAYRPTRDTRISTKYAGPRSAFGPLSPRGESTQAR